MRRILLTALFGIAALCVTNHTSSIFAEEKPGGRPSEKTESDNTKKRDQSGTRSGSETRKKSPEKNREAAKAKPDKPIHTPRNLAVLGLKRVIEDATIKDMLFEDFAEWIARETGANVIVRWDILKPAGIDRGSKITASMKNIELGKLLVLVFDRLTEGKTGVELAAHADGNTLTISTRKDLNAKLVTRVYDVQDLIQLKPDFEAFGHEKEHQPVSPARSKSRAKHQRQSRKLDPVVLELIDAITNNIDPASWRIAGGKGRISFFRDKLVIYNSLEVHQIIGGAIEGRE